MNRVLSVLALILAVAATGIAIDAHLRADAAVERRERELIRNLWPKMQPVYRDIGTGDPPTAEPATIEELLDPLFEVVDPR